MSNPAPIATIDLSVLDAMPLMVFLVNDDVCVLHANASARKHLSSSEETLNGLKSGDILRCIHAAENPGGCGCSVSCKTCVIRNSVNKAAQGGSTTRSKAVNQVYSATGVSKQHLLITATPFGQSTPLQILLVVEDITDLVELKNLIPICSCCKSIRNTDDTWERVESYLHKNLDLDFTHGVCPECAEKLYPGMAAKLHALRGKLSPGETSDPHKA